MHPQVTIFDIVKLDPLAAWHALPDEEREAILARLRGFAGGDIEVFATTRDGDDLVVHALNAYSYTIPQQVGADLIDYAVRAIVAIGTRATIVRQTSDTRDERENYDSSVAIAALRQRCLDALFGPATSDEEDAFLAAIDAAPDDDGPRVVYIDWLQQRGDPRGEAMAIQRAGAGADLAKLVKGFWWLDLEHTIFDRGFVRVYGLSQYFNRASFDENVDYFARLRPLPAQFVSEGRDMFACISGDRRRFATAYSSTAPTKKRASGTWAIIVGRCADRSTLFTAELPWTRNSNRIESIAFTRDNTLEVARARQPPLHLALPEFR